MEGSPLTYAIVTGPAHGTLSGTAPNLTYTPAASYSGPDSFTFKANDGAADSNVASVLIQVNAVPPACETNTGTVPSPGFLTTDTEADGATPGDPIETILITPVGGTVSIQECRIPQPAPTAFTFLDVQAQVTASPGTAAQPMTLVFVLDASILPPGTTAANAVVFRNGVHLAGLRRGNRGRSGPLRRQPCDGERRPPDRRPDLSRRSLDVRRTALHERPGGGDRDRCSRSPARCGLHREHDWRPACREPDLRWTAPTCSWPTRSPPSP